MAPELEKQSGKDLAGLVASLRDQLLELGATDAVVRASRAVQKQLKFANSKVVKNSSETIDAVKAFVSVDGRTSSASALDLSPKSVSLLAKNLVSAASKLPKNPNFLGIAKGPFSYSKKGFFDSKIVSWNEEAVDVLDGAINAATSAGAGRCAGILEWSSGEDFVATSGGVEAQEKGSSVYFSFRALSEGGSSGHKVGVSRSLSKLDFKGIAERAARLAVESKEPAEVVPGKYDVVFDSLPIACLLNAVGSATSFFSVESGFSFLANQIGKKVASDKVSFFDDGLIENGYNSAVFDDEGVPVQRTALIEKGTLKSFLHNTSTAKRNGVKTTGNAGLVSPSPWNLVLSPGKSSFNELVGEVKKGIYLTNVWYLRFQNYLTGDFSVIPRDAAFLIENGRLTKPLHHLRISDSLPNLLKSIDVLGKESEQIYGWEVDTPVFTPPVLVRGLNITRPN